jgi:hypothetical protein
MHDRQPASPASWVMQPILPVATRSAWCGDVAELALAQLPGDLGLEDVVGAGRAAADMALRHLLDLEAGARQQAASAGLIFWPCCIEQAEW